MKKVQSNKYFRQSKWSICLMALTALCSCSTSENDNMNYRSEFNLYVVQGDSLVYDFGDASLPLTEIEKKINSTLDNYAVKMLLTYSKGTSKNTLLSPISATTLYSLMANFTGDQQSNKYLENMGIEDYDMSDVNSYCRKIDYQSKASNTSDASNTGNSSFNIDSKMWIDQNTTVYDSFLSTTNAYNVSVRGVDFKNLADIEAINQNATTNMENNTEGIDRSSWANTKSIVTTVMDFKKTWKTEMGISNNDSTFINDNGSTTICKMLQVQSDFNYCSFDEFDMLELPYSDETYSAYIIYPHNANLLDKSLAAIQQIGLDKCISLMGTEKVLIRVPEFTLEGITSLNSQELSSSTGIKQMYNSKLSKASPDGFELNDIYQAYNIDFNGKGTSVILTSGSSIVKSNYSIHIGSGSKQTVNAKEFIVKHPFALLIRNNKLKSTVNACCIKALNI